MATKNIVPRADGEGGVGTSAKKWGNFWTRKVNGNDPETLLHPRKNSTVYAVGDVAFAASAPSSIALVCVMAGQTAASEPDFSSAEVGQTVVDGSVTWLYRDLLGVDITELKQMLNLKLSISDAPAVCTPFAFPSATQLNVPVTNTTSMNYTAPANGYVAARMSETSANGYIRVGNSPFYSYAFSNAAGLTTWRPVRKGETVDITVLGTGRTIVQITFIYAEGEV